MSGALNADPCQVQGGQHHQCGWDAQAHPPVGGEFGLLEGQVDGQDNGKAEHQGFEPVGVGANHEEKHVECGENAGDVGVGGFSVVFGGKTPEDACHERQDDDAVVDDGFNAAVGE